MSQFGKVPLSAYFQQRYPAAARDLYVGLRCLLYRKTGNYDQDLETSCEEIVTSLHLPRRTVWSRLASAEECGLIERVDGDVPLTIRFKAPWASTQGVPCAGNSTPAPNSPTEPPSTGAPATQTGQSDPSTPTPGTSTTPDPMQSGGAESSTEGASRAGNSTLFKDHDDDNDHNLVPGEHHHHQIFPERAENSTPPTGNCAGNGTVLAELRAFGLEEAVATDLAPTCTLSQVQAGILAAMQELKSETHPRGLERKSLPGWLVNRLRRRMWASAAEIPLDRWAAIKARDYQEHDQAEQLEQKYRGGRYGHLIMS